MNPAQMWGLGGGGGYIPVLGWEGVNHEFSCMRITTYSGPET